MKLPEITKQIGTEQDDKRIYIEDYVYAYLRELKADQAILPLRVALYGHACLKEQKKYYLIYGAASVIEELERGRDEEQIRRDFFPEYELIGYVNIYGDGGRLPDKRDGYFVFYEQNEAMQNYLIRSYERNKRQQDGRAVSGIQKADLRDKRRKVFPVLEVLKSLLYGCIIVLLTIAVTTINDYQKISGFTEAVNRAIMLVQTMG